jgi:hypothetical protein
MTTPPRRPSEGAERKIEEAAVDAKETAEHTAQDVLHAFRKGRDDAIDAVERTLPAVKRSMSKGVYVFCYYLSFGAVYTAELAMSVVPQDSAIRHGFRDGAAAAREAYTHHKSAQGAPVADGATA